MGEFAVHQQSVSEALQRVLEGSLVAYVWESTVCEIPEFQVRFVEPGAELQPSDHGLPPAVADVVGLELSGIMPPERAAQKIAELQRALRRKHQ